MINTALSGDTICAIATPIGEAGIGIVKMSGPQSLSVLKGLFRPSRAVTPFQSHRLYHGWIHEPASGDKVDEVLTTFMRAPHTYTREDIVEIHCHGGYSVLHRVLRLVLDRGVRMAEPGEFTRRAFLNGRIDLSQAEAVIDVIRSRSDKSLELAARQLQGELRHRVQGWRETLLQLQSRIEAAIDFADDLDDEEPESHLLVQTLHRELIEPLEEAVAHYRSGRVVREGLTMVLVGRPNVGKSSLLNALVGKKRAIVTHHPGTTRDVIEDSFILAGVQVRILDTAGIREKPDEIESMGIHKTLESIEQADVILCIVDSSSPLTDEDEIVFRSIGIKPSIILLNKSDLPRAVGESEVLNRFGREVPVLSLSVLDPAHIRTLEACLTENFLKEPIDVCSTMTIPNLRQKECFERALQSLKQAGRLIQEERFGELVSLELRSGRQQLEAVLGWDGDDELLDKIFSDFCIGK